MQTPWIQGSFHEVLHVYFHGDVVVIEIFTHRIYVCTVVCVLACMEAGCINCLHVS